MSRDVPARTPLGALGTHVLTNARRGPSSSEVETTNLPTSGPYVSSKPGNPSSLWRAALNFPQPEPKFLGDFRLDASDTEEDEDEDEGDCKSEPEMKSSHDMLGVVTAKMRRRAEERAETEARAAAARRVTEAAKRAEEDKKKRGRLLVDRVRRASRTAALVKESAVVAKRTERLTMQTQRNELDQIWNAELKFAASRNDWRGTWRPSSGVAPGVTMDAGNAKTAKRLSVEFNGHDSDSVPHPKLYLPPPNVEEAMLHRQYLTREITVYDGRCVLCARGEMHGVDVCGLVPEAIRRTQYVVPAIASAGFETSAAKSPATAAQSAARACTAVLLNRRTKKDTHNWFTYESPKAARLGMQTLKLERRALGPRLPVLTNFFALTNLDVSRNKLTGLPDDVDKNCPLLESIDCSVNQLTILPECLGNLFFLKKLTCRGNKLRELPEFTNTKELLSLDASANPELKRLPQSITTCVNLMELLLDGCGALHTLPDTLGDVQDALTTVRARHCSLLKCPYGLALANGLTYLDLGKNRLKTLPDDTGGFQQPKLRVLRLDDNELTELPYGLQSADALEVLDVSRNSLTDIDYLTSCGSLTDLNVSRNKISKVPRLLAGGPVRAKAAFDAKQFALMRARKVMDADDSITGTDKIGSILSKSTLKISPYTIKKNSKEALKVAEQLRRAERQSAAAALADASRVVGLRKFRCSFNRITRLPPCLGATLEVGGIDGRVLDVGNNPLETSVARLIASENGINTYIARLADVHFATAALDENVTVVSQNSNRHATTPTRGGATRNSATSKQSSTTHNNSDKIQKNREEMYAARRAEFGLKIGSRRYVKKIRESRVSWHAEDFDFLFAEQTAKNVNFPKRHLQIETERVERVSNRVKFISQRAKKRWRLAIFSVLKHITPNQAAAVEAVEGLARAELFLETAKLARAQSIKTEASKYQWILDLNEPFDVLPHRLLVALAKKSRAFVSSKHETIWRTGDPGDFAVVVVEGTCRLHNLEDDDEDETTGVDAIVSQLETDTMDGKKGRRTGSQTGPRGVLSGSAVVAACERRNVEPPKKPGSFACAGISSLLTGDPRRLKVTVTSDRARYMSITRAALSEVLHEDDKQRGEEFKRQQTEIALAARRKASDFFSSEHETNKVRSFCASDILDEERGEEEDMEELDGPTCPSTRSDTSGGSPAPSTAAPSTTTTASTTSRASIWARQMAEAETEAKLLDAEAKSLKEHAVFLLENPPEPTPRDNLFTAEAIRVLRSGDACLYFDSLPKDSSEFKELLVSTVRRVRKTAHCLGLAPKVGTHDGETRFLFPWFRGWRDGGWFHASHGADWNRKYNVEYFLAGRDFETPVELTEKLTSAGVVARDRLRNSTFFTNAFNASELRHIASFIGAETVTCTSGGGGGGTVHGENTHGDTKISKASLMGIVDTRAERVEKLITQQRYLFQERKVNDIDDTGTEPNTSPAAFVVLNGKCELRRDGAVVSTNVGAGNVIGAVHVLTGAKPELTATAMAMEAFDGAEYDALHSNGSQVKRLETSVVAVAVQSNALKAIVDRRPTVLDTLAMSIAREECAQYFPDDDDTSRSPRERLRMDLLKQSAISRRAARILAASEFHFGKAKFAWVRVIDHVLGEVRKKRLQLTLQHGGVEGFKAAALGVAGASQEGVNADAGLNAHSPLTKAEKNKRKFARGQRDDKLFSEIAKSTPFTWLTFRELQTVVTFGCRRVCVRRDGEPLTVQGNHGGTAFLVLKGKLEGTREILLDSSVDGQFMEPQSTHTTRVTKKRYGRGDVIGVLSVFTGAERDETIWASSDEVWVLEISRRAFMQIAKNRPTALDEIATSILSLSGIDDDSGSINQGSMPTQDTYNLLFMPTLDSVTSWVLRGERFDLLRPEILSGSGGATRTRIAFGEKTDLAMRSIENAVMFSGLDRVRKLIMLHDAGRFVTHPVGADVVTQCDDGHTMFAVVSGVLEVVVEALRDDDDSDRLGTDLTRVQTTAVRTLRPGDVFGELSLLTGAPRNATIRVVQQSIGDILSDADQDSSGAAVLVELGSSAIVPLLRKNDTDFARSASLATARRYHVGRPDETQAQKAVRIEQNALRLEQDMRSFHESAVAGKKTENKKVSANSTRFALKNAFQTVFDANAPVTSVDPKLSNATKKVKGHWRDVLRTSHMETAKKEGFDLFDDAFTKRLRRHPFFGLLTSTELKTLRTSALVKKASAGGTPLKTQGDLCDGVLVIVTGVVNVRSHGGHKNQPVIKPEELKPWSVVGVKCCLENKNGEGELTSWPATLAAAPPSVEAVEIPGESIRSVIENRPTLKVLVEDLVRSGGLR